MAHSEEETLDAERTCIFLGIKDVISTGIALKGRYRHYLTSVTESLRVDANDGVVVGEGWDKE